MAHTVSFILYLNYYVGRKKVEGSECKKTPFYFHASACTLPVIQFIVNEEPPVD